MDKIIEVMSKADISMLFVIVVGFIWFVYYDQSKRKDIIEKIDELENTIIEKNKDLEEEISSKHGLLGSEVSGRYKNLGEKIDIEHSEINEDTRSIYNFMSTEKQNREALYYNSSRAREILETIDVMREAVDQNARLHSEVNALKQENQEILKEKNKYTEVDELLSAIRSFNNTLGEFETKEAGEIKEYLELIKKDILKYIS